MSLNLRPFDAGFRRTSLLLAAAVILFVGCGQFGSKDDLRTPSSDDLVGTYVSNPSYGDAVLLSLAADGSYDARWSGHMGEYGRASGTWRLAGEGVEFRPIEDGELFFTRLRRLNLVPYRGTYSLAYSKDLVGEKVGESNLFKRQ